MCGSCEKKIKAFDISFVQNREWSPTHSSRINYVQLYVLFKMVLFNNPGHSESIGNNSNNNNFITEYSYVMTDFVSSRTFLNICIQSIFV